ncbi:hypothetical protein CDD80_3197 [Ophiocordyceps camponoti-rufipedis]|uniref:Uncharacterized protein n=1 Tax=Ophiocordyceps camponoti-rufipedis TaxID=2004952 RepID=A0A2C5Z4G5_9HYPO|nr:hypothetical protein CDD80_3197 [Ophiocordyceps camponoti-rufipedis]
MSSNLFPPHTHESIALEARVEGLIRAGDPRWRRDQVVATARRGVWKRYHLSPRKTGGADPSPRTWPNSRPTEKGRRDPKSAVRMSGEGPFHAGTTSDTLNSMAGPKLLAAPRGGQWQPQQRRVAAGGLRVTRQRIAIDYRCQSTSGAVRGTSRLGETGSRKEAKREGDGATINRVANSPEASSRAAKDGRARSRAPQGWNAKDRQTDKADGQRVEGWDR